MDALLQRSNQSEQTTDAARFYVTVRCPSVRPSRASVSIGKQQSRPAGLLLNSGAGSRHRSTAAAAARHRPTGRVAVRIVQHTCYAKAEMLSLSIDPRPLNSGLGRAGHVLALALADAVKLRYINSNI